MKRKNLLLVAVFSLLSIVCVQRAAAVEFIVNGGFETGSFNPWTIVSSQPAPFTDNVGPRTGSFSAFLGSPGGGETPGNSAIFSNLTAVLPANAMLSFWFNGTTTDSITFDWQDAYVTDAAGTILATIMHVCVTTPGYTNVTFNLNAFAGQQIRIEFLVHGDNAGDPTSMRVDDVSIQGVPEPSVASLGLLGFGALAATAVVRRMRRAAA